MKSTPTLITATEMQQKSGQLLKRAFTRQEHFIVERNGYPIAAIIPIDDYRRLKRGDTKKPAAPNA